LQPRRGTRPKPRLIPRQRGFSLGIEISGASIYPGKVLPALATLESNANLVFDGHIPLKLG